MTDEDFLRRFDARLAIGNEHLATSAQHLARGNELQQRGNELFARNGELFERNGELFERNGELFERSNELFERNSKLMTELRLEFAENRKASAAHQQALQDIRFELRQMSLRGERVANGFVTVLQDLHEESLAQRQALFAVIDQLKGDGPAPAGA